MNREDGDRMNNLRSAPISVAGGHFQVHTRLGGVTALVFLHYWGGSHRTFTPVINAMTNDGTAVTFDQRGWGEARTLPGPFGIHQLADDVIGVAGALGLERYVLVGHSMGAKVALLAASRRPVGLAGLVLIAPAPPKPTIDVETARQRAHAYDDSAAVTATLDRALTYQALPTEIREQVIEDSLAADDEARRAWPLEGLLEDITHAVTTIDVPVLVIAGERDRVDPPTALQTNLLPFVPASRMTVLEATGHLSPLEAPLQVAAEIDRFMIQINSLRR